MHIPRTAASIAAAITAALLLVLVPAANAACSDDTVPGGNSEADQYVETVPGSCGDRDPGGGGSDGAGDESSGGGRGSGALPERVAEELEGFGPDGAAAASVARETAPSAGDSGREPENGAAREQTAAGPPSSASGGPSVPEGSAVEGLAGVAEGEAEGGLGVGLPIVLAVLLLGALGFAAFKRRSA